MRFLGTTIAVQSLHSSVNLNEAWKFQGHAQSPGTPSCCQSWKDLHWSSGIFQCSCRATIIAVIVYVPWCFRFLIRAFPWNSILNYLENKNPPFYMYYLRLFPITLSTSSCHWRGAGFVTPKYVISIILGWLLLFFFFRKQQIQWKSENQTEIILLWNNLHL